jgi:preprotein translocase subunit SecA
VDEADAMPLREARVNPETEQPGWGHFTVDQKRRAVALTPRGMELVLRKLRAQPALAAPRCPVGAGQACVRVRRACTGSGTAPRGRPRGMRRMRARAASATGVGRRARGRAASITPRARGAEEAGARFPSAEAERRAPALADLWEEEGTSWGAHVLNALRARALFQRDVHYIVRDGEVRIVDTSTGRVLPISRWTDGMHQARPLPNPGHDLAHCRAWLWGKRFVKRRTRADAGDHTGDAPSPRAAARAASACSALLQNMARGRARLRAAG